MMPNNKKVLKHCISQHLSTYSLEATIGFEPMNQGVADPRLTTWLCRHNNILVSATRKNEHSREFFQPNLINISFRTRRNER